MGALSQNLKELMNKLNDYYGENMCLQDNPKKYTFQINYHGEKIVEFNYEICNDKKFLDGLYEKIRSSVRFIFK